MKCKSGAIGAQHLINGARLFGSRRTSSLLSSPSSAGEIIGVNGQTVIRRQHHRHRALYDAKTNRAWMTVLSHLLLIARAMGQAVGHGQCAVENRAGNLLFVRDGKLRLQCRFLFGQGLAKGRNASRLMK